MAKTIAPPAPPENASAAAESDAPAPGAAQPNMSVGDIVAILVKQAKKGKVTYDQLNAIQEEAVNDPAKLDSILEELEKRGLELVEDTSDGDPGEGGEEGGEDGATGAFESYQAPEETEAEIGEKIDDPVRMYLSQMGEIPLLNRDQEIELARRIEIYRDGFRRKVMTTLDAVKRGIQWVEEQKEIWEQQEKNAKSHGSSPARDERIDRAANHLSTLHRITAHAQSLSDGVLLKDASRAHAEQVRIERVLRNRLTRAYRLL
ncbi:MAG TPA: hypothetical protein DCS97_12675, partial [Planctomycetes bacterium]|nr:hypothetical protein [Planctomycetota bacterium]